MRPNLLAAVPLAAAAAAAAAAACAGAAPEICNGHAELCGRRYDNVTFVGAHDSPFVGPLAADNQNIPVSAQLALGVRFLQAQTHDGGGGSIQLCHSACLLRDAGPLACLLAPVKAFLDANPAEVVTLLLTNPDGFETAAFADVFRATGLEPYAFAPAPAADAGDGSSAAQEWPTLGEMIATGKRLVVFMDYPKSPSVPYILDEFGSFVVETPFEYDELTDFSSCPIDRPPGGTTADRMLLMNHWLQRNFSGVILVPDRCQAPTTNAEQYLMRHAQSCETSLQRTPNFILLDWVDVGDGLRVQDMLNGLEPERDAIEPGTPVEGCLGDPDEPDEPDAKTKRRRGR